MTSRLYVRNPHGVNFNSHPHEEDDPSAFIAGVIARHFNSHPHEEDDEERAARIEAEKTFQLTSSRRG